MSKRTLKQFAMDKQRKVCGVCSLPRGVKNQMQRRRVGRSQLSLVLEWIHEEYGVKITEAQYTSHCRRKHEVGATSGQRGGG